MGRPLEVLISFTFSQSYDTFGSFTFDILIMSPLGGKRAGTGWGMGLDGEWCGLCVV